MSGLIWLWQNIPNGTVPPIDYGVYPRLEVIFSPSPTITFIPSANNASTTSTTYNQSNVQYNSGTQTYGGVGGASTGPGPTIIQVGNIC